MDEPGTRSAESGRSVSRRSFSRSIVLDSAAIDALLDYSSLSVRLVQAWRPDIATPPRLVLETPGGTPNKRLIRLVMAAARAGGGMLVKQVAIAPHAGLCAHAVFSDETGKVIAYIDGDRLTARRTAAASVMAATRLARPDSATLGVIGAGIQAAANARAFAACRPLDGVVVWARDEAKARTFAAALRRDTGLVVDVCGSVATAVGTADIVTVATRATEPLVLAKHVRPGTHIDLVGGFRPWMREADDGLIARAAVYVDTVQAIEESGDLAGPVAAGVIAARDVIVIGNVIDEPPRRTAGEITVYKSVGFAALDLVAAELAVERAGVAT